MGQICTGAPRRQRRFVESALHFLLDAVFEMSLKSFNGVIKRRAELAAELISLGIISLAK
jgi:hypothetical protein